LSCIGEGVITTDNQGIVTFLNPVAEKLTAWSKGDALGVPLTTVFQIVNEHTRQLVENPVLRALRSTRIFGRPVDLPLWGEMADQQVKLALTSTLVPRPAPMVPLQQPAQQPMLQQPGLPQTLPAAGASPVAPGAPTMTGVPQKPIGLDQPCDTRAAAIPGTPGHAATNVIDQYGALDPRGLTVDGNNSAAVTKIPKMAALLPPVGATSPIWQWV